MTPDLNAVIAQPWFPVVALIVLVWTLMWKGFALWRAATDNSKLWFVVMMIINTLGVLEIVYLFAISPMRQKLKSAPKAR